MSLQKREAKRIKSSGRGADAKHLWRKQLTLPCGRRSTIQLGALTVKYANEVDRHIESLLAAKRHGSGIEPQVQQWLKSAEKKLITKLVSLGLCEARNDPFVPAFVADYIAGRSVNWAHSTIVNFGQLEKLLKERFAKKRISELTRKDALDFFNWMRKTKGLGENTARRKFGRTREMFTDAVENGLLTENVFKIRAVKIAVGAANKTYIDEATIVDVIDHCPTTEWKLLFAFARWVGCRIPSEIEQLRWADINFDKQTILITSPKTARYGKGERLVPIFPELAELLNRHWEEAEEGAEYVFGKLRHNTNLGTTAKRYVKAAGILPWSDFFNTLRASRETDLMDSHGPNDACRWIGNSLAVAAKHYQLLRKEAYAGRVVQFDDSSTESAGSKHRFDQVKDYANPNRQFDDETDDEHARIGQNGAEKKAANPIKTRICCPTSTPARN